MMEQRAAEDGFSPITGTSALYFTGERIVPGLTPETLFREHEERYLFAAQFVHGKDVLDVACGTGIGTQYLLNTGAARCWGIDIDAEAIECAKTAYKNCTFIHGDATSLSLPEKSVDVVVSFETIEHLRDQSRFVLECCRVLRPGGLLVCSTPNRNVSRWWRKNPFHVHELGIIEYKQLLERSFTDVQLYAQGPRAYLPEVTRLLTIRVLDRLGLKDRVKRITRRHSASPYRDQFGRAVDGSREKIRPYRPSYFVQPIYIVAVNRKPVD
jgi:SAM-dependent methyltransferase